jgi:hypothetical protein
MVRVIERAGWLFQSRNHDGWEGFRSSWLKLWGALKGMVSIFPASFAGLWLSDTRTLIHARGRGHISQGRNIVDSLQTVDNPTAEIGSYVQLDTTRI